MISLPESKGEALQTTPSGRMGQGRQGGRIDPATEEKPHRHVADKMGLQGVLQCLTGLLQGLTVNPALCIPLKSQFAEEVYLQTCAGHRLPGLVLGPTS